MRRAVIAMVIGVTVAWPLVAAGKGTPTAQTASPVAGDIGRSRTWNDWTVTLVGAEFVPDIEADSWPTETARGRFLIVRVTLVNDGNAPRDFPYLTTRATDQRHRTFTPDFDATFALHVGDPDIESDDLQPGIAYPFAVVFDVAPDATGFRLSLGEKDGPSFDLGV